MMERWKKNLLLLWISQILVVVGYAAALPFIPLFISERYGITDDRTLGLIVSWFHFVSTGSFAVMAPIWGRLADRYGRKLMLLRACFMDAVIFPLMVYAPNMTVLFILRILASMFTGTTSAAQPLIVSGTPKERHGFALGLLSTALWSGNMLGYLFGGLIVNYFGFNDCAHWGGRGDFSIDEWFDMIYDEINAGYPVLDFKANALNGRRWHQEEMINIVETFIEGEVIPHQEKEGRR